MDWMVSILNKLCKNMQVVESDHVGRRNEHRYGECGNHGSALMTQIHRTPFPMSRTAHLAR